MIYVPKVWMYFYLVNFVGLGLEGLVLRVLGVVLAQVDRDLVQLGPDTSVHYDDKA